MSGTLYHSKEFVTVDYIGVDQQKHYEIRPVDGDCLSLGHTTWAEMQTLAEANGMPRKTWPEFLDYDFGIDVPLEDVLAKQEIFRLHLLQLSVAVVGEHYWLGRIVDWVRRGESVFFCGN